MAKYAGIDRDPDLDGWTFTCPAPCGFQSRGWPKKDQALERKQQHLAEHQSADAYQATGNRDDLALMEPHEDFMARHGLAGIDRHSQTWRDLIEED